MKNILRSLFSPFKKMKYKRKLASLPYKVEQPVVFNIEDQKLNIGKNAKIGPYVRLGGVLEIGMFTNVQRYTEIFASKDNRNKISIGRFCAIAPHTVMRSVAHVTDYPSISTRIQGICQFRPPVEDMEKGPIIIGNDVWIGQQAIILGNVNIGDGAVIAAGAVVTKDVAPYEFVAGVPAKHVKYRFEQNVIDQLLEIRWWLWDEEKILRNKNFFATNLSKLNPNCRLSDLIKD